MSISVYFAPQATSPSQPEQDVAVNIPSEQQMEFFLKSVDYFNTQDRFGWVLDLILQPQNLFGFNQPSLSKNEIIEAYRAVGKSYEKKGDRGEYDAYRFSLAYFLKVTQLGSENIEDYKSIGKAVFWTNIHDDAKDAFLQALDSDWLIDREQRVALYDELGSVLMSEANLKEKLQRESVQGSLGASAMPNPKASEIVVAMAVLQEGVQPIYAENIDSLKTSTLNTYLRDIDSAISEFEKVLMEREGKREKDYYEKLGKEENRMVIWLDDAADAATETIFNEKDRGYFEIELLKMKTKKVEVEQVLQSRG